MTEHLTNPYGEKNKLYVQTYPGMMAWAGTGPENKTCRECESYRGRGFYSVNGKHRGGLKPGTCAKFARYMGHKGPSFPHHAKSCNKFEQSTTPLSTSANPLAGLL